MIMKSGGIEFVCEGKMCVLKGDGETRRVEGLFPLVMALSQRWWHGEASGARLEIWHIKLGNRSGSTGFGRATVFKMRFTR